MRPSAYRIIRSPVAMVLVAFGIRIAYILIQHCYRLNYDYWQTFEMAVIGRSLATGKGYSMGFGPSAWTAPLYPYLLATIFRLFGIFTHSAALAVLTFNSIVASLTCWTIFGIARRVFDESVAVWSGWLWAVLPNSIYFSAYWIWETSLSTFLVSLLFLLTLLLENDSRLWPWCRYGVLWALAALSSAALLSWLPFAGCWLAYRLYRGGQRFLAPTLAGAAMFWITLSPWLVRTTRIFGFPVIRSEFGVELRCGNNPEAQGWWVSNYSYNNTFLRHQFETLGEPVYVRQQGQLARQWIAEHPQRFIALTFYRFIYFWGGIPHEGLDRLENIIFTAASVLSLAGLVLAIKRKRHAIFLFATQLLVFPLVYYITFPTPRYRHPIEPQMLILAVSLMLSAAARFRHGSLAHDSVACQETRKPEPVSPGFLKVCL